MNGIRTAAGVVAVMAAVAALSSGCDSQPAAGKANAVSAAERAKLPTATTFGTVRGAPADPSPGSELDGSVVQVTKDAVVYDKPGGRAIALLPAKQLSGPTWVPVIAEKPGWRQVLLPSRPNHASGWLPDGGLKAATSSYRVDVDVKSHRLTVTDGGHRVGDWKVAVGTAKNPTPSPIDSGCR